MTTTWHGCYDDSWRDLIVDEAFAHPAKFARGLIERIYAHIVLDYGLCAGAVVVDPFGGVALGALDAMRHGLVWRGVELEEKFVDLGRQNLLKWESYYPDGDGRLIQGDSRNLCELVAVTLADVVVGSPPYSESIQARSGPSGLKGVDGTGLRTNGKPLGMSRADLQMNAEGYGQTPGQLGAMRPGKIEEVT